MTPALERQLAELRKITGQLLPVLDDDDRRVLALLDLGADGTRQIVLEDPAPLPANAVRAVLPAELPLPPIAWRAYVNRNPNTREIETVDIRPVSAGPPPLP
jgi:hypothetical protein